MLKRIPRQTSITKPPSFGAAPMYKINFYITIAAATLLLAATLILAAMFVGRMGGADGYPLLPEELFTNQDALLVSLQGRTPVSPTPTPYSETSSIQVVP